MYNSGAIVAWLYGIHVGQTGINEELGPHLAAWGSHEQKIARTSPVLPLWQFTPPWHKEGVPGHEGSHVASTTTATGIRRKRDLTLEDVQ